MAKQRRLFRVSERIQAILATTLPRLSDPRLDLITITSVVTTTDLMLAKVYWTTLGGGKRREDVAEGLQAASGLLRSVVAKELKLRTAPSLRFYYDETFDVQNQIDELMERVSALEGADQSEQSESVLQGSNGNVGKASDKRSLSLIASEEA